MQAQITARHFEATPALREFAIKRLSKLEVFYDGINDVRVVLREEQEAAADKSAEITVSVYKNILAARETAETHEEAISRCVDRLRKQLLRYKAKRRAIDKKRLN